MPKRPPHPVDLHPLLGALDDDGSVTGIFDEYDERLRSPQPGPLVSRLTEPVRPEDVILDDVGLPPTIYCDHCGHVGGHAHDCPETAMERAAHEERLEQLAEVAEQRSSIRYLLRKAAAAALRRLARRVAGE